METRPSGSERISNGRRADLGQEKRRSGTFLKLLGLSWRTGEPAE
jgi:hypothetical protein